MSDETTVVAVPETPAAPVAPVERSAADIRQGIRERAIGRTQTHHSQTQPRTEVGQFAAVHTPATEPQAASPASAVIEAPKPSILDSIEIPEGHPLRDRGKTRLSQLEAHEFQNVLNASVRAREVEAVRNELNAAKLELAKAQAAAEVLRQQRTQPNLSEQEIQFYNDALQAYGPEYAALVLKGLQEKMDAPITAKQQEAEAAYQDQLQTQQAEQFVQSAFQTAAQTFPREITSLPSFEGAFHQARVAYGNRLMQQEAAGYEVAPSEADFMQILRVHLVADPFVQQVIQQGLQQQEQARLNSIRQQAEREAQQKQQNELAALSQKRQQNPFARLPSGSNAGQAVPVTPRRNAASIRQDVRNRANGRSA